MSYIMIVVNNWDVILTGVLSLVGGASLLAATISRLTSNTIDDRAATWLQRVHQLLNRLAFNPKK